jgi:hypothetical protein
MGEVKHRFAQDHIILSSITNCGDILLRAGNALVKQGGG